MRMSRGSLVVAAHLAGLLSASSAASATGDERVERGLGEDDVVGDEHVVGVELVDGERCARSARLRSDSQRDVVVALEHDEHVARGRSAPASERRRGLGRRARRRSTSASTTWTRPLRARSERAPRRAAAFIFLGVRWRVVARLRAVDDATAGELRRAGRALAGAAGALLLVRLAATAADLAAGLGGVRALAGGGQLGHDDLVDQRDVGLDVEDLGGQVDLDGLGWPCVGLHALPSRPSGRTTRPPRGAGDGALEQEQALLGVDGVDREVLGGHARRRPCGRPCACP